jgi:hypothetical protein
MPLSSMAPSQARRFFIQVLCPLHELQNVQIFSCRKFPPCRGRRCHGAGGFFNQGNPLCQHLADPSGLGHFD